MLDPARIRSDFPILSREINGHPLVYLDSAATSQKPNAMIDAVVDYYRNHNANVHRGVHRLGDEATEAYEHARTTVAQFINADVNEVIFVRNTTEAINLVASTWAMTELRPGHEVVVSSYEHHSNLIPWQRVCRERGAKLRFLPMDAEQSVSETGLDVIGPRTKLVAIGHVSNAFGSIAPVGAIVRAARAVGATILLDGAQSVPHMPVDVRQLDIDFLAFSGHKMCGPMGIGVLWGRADLLEKMDPFLVGGGMIETVSYEDTLFADPVGRFEAGTPNVADAVGLAAAINYLKAIGMDTVQRHERDLVAYGMKILSAVPGVRVFGPLAVENHSGVVSFSMDGIHPHDIGTILDDGGIAIRAGKHCCHPAMQTLGIPGTARASVYIYNTRSDLDRLVEQLDRVQKIMVGPKGATSHFCE